MKTTTRYDHALKMYTAFGTICDIIGCTRNGTYGEREGLGYLRMTIREFLHEYQKFKKCFTQVHSPDAYQCLFTSDDFLAYTIFTTNIMKQMGDLVAIVKKMCDTLGFDYNEMEQEH